MINVEVLAPIQPTIQLSAQEKDTLRAEFLVLPKKTSFEPEKNVEDILQKARDAKVPNPTVESLTIDHLISPQSPTHNEEPQSGKAD